MEMFSAVIGFAGVIVGSLLTIFSDEIKASWVGRSKRSAEFKGRWRCTWTHGGDPSAAFVDTVQITKASGEKLFATGSNAAGTYALTGTIESDDVILFTYSGEGLHDSLGGAVVAIANKKRTKLEGMFLECLDGGAFTSGATKWEKAN